MGKGTVRVIYGPGSGKTATAMGYGLMGVFHRKKVIVVQFLKGELDEEDSEMVKMLEPDLKVFRFDRSQDKFENLSEEEKKEELINLKNAFNFARKVMITGECDLLILDEILGLLDQGIISTEEFKGLLDLKTEESDLIMTGRVWPKELNSYADKISYLENMDTAEQA